MTEHRFDVEHRAAESRYVLVDREPTEGGPKEIGQEQYVEHGDGDARVRIFHHTAVSEEYGGQGLASVLVRAAIEHAASEGFQVVPVCPYVAKWVEKHPDYAEHAAKVRPEHVEALRNRTR